MYTDYAEFSEADYFADQAGVYEIRKSSNEKLGQVMMQVCHDLYTTCTSSTKQCRKCIE